MLVTFSQFRNFRVAFALPRFQFGTKYEEDLMLVLKNIGLEAAALDDQNVFFTIFIGNCGCIDQVEKTINQCL